MYALECQCIYICIYIYIYVYIYVYMCVLDVSVPCFVSPGSSEDCARKTVQIPAAEAEVRGFGTSSRLTSAEHRYLVGSFWEEISSFKMSLYDLI